VAHSAMQRSDSAIVVDVRDVDIVDVHDTKAPAVSAPPRMEPVTRSEREPAEAAPSAEADVEPKAAAPAPEGDIRRRPQRVVASPHRTRPPRPGCAIGEPASIVIRRPAPRLVTY